MHDAFSEAKKKQDDRKGMTNGKSEKDDGPELKALQWEMTNPKVEELNICGASGLDLPERLFWETFIMRQNISAVEDWETGRESEYAFQNSNLHTTRDGAAGKTDPRACVWQFDDQWCMNPRGLVMAYEELTVRPVCSDMDAFLIGSKGMKVDPLPPEQLEITKWSLDHIQEMLEGKFSSWMGAWLQILEREAAAGNNIFSKVPKWGFGDAKTTELTKKLVEAVHISGAVRHGAECFNFSFPQDLDDEYLIIWDGFAALSWKNVNPKQLRKFLLDRANEGYAFPLNPKWIIADCWHEVFDALMENAAGRESLQTWYTKPSGTLDRIEELRKRFPQGFVPRY
jgi:hypothetical protein